ncbi:MAG: 50S ribosomal protein L29 [Ignavibacteriaceae bacterium]|jgi:large subunit ribosomal protein L29
MNIREIREMKTDELTKRINEEEKNMIDLRFSHQLKELTNTAKLKLAKKDIARMKSILRERQLADQKSADVEKKEEGASA